MTSNSRPRREWRANLGVVDVMLIVALAALLLSIGRSLRQNSKLDYETSKYADVQRRPVLHSGEVLQYTQIPVRVDSAWLFRIHASEDLVFKVISNGTEEISLPIGPESEFFTIAFENDGRTVRIGNGITERELLVTQRAGGISFEELNGGTSVFPVIVATSGEPTGPHLEFSISKH